jgi:hypothetical protein
VAGGDRAAGTGAVNQLRCNSSEYNYDVACPAGPAGRRASRRNTSRLLKPSHFALVGSRRYRDGAYRKLKDDNDEVRV